MNSVNSKNKIIEKLYQVEICVTSVCNLKCTHCYQAESKNKFILDYNLIKSVIDYGKEHGCNKFVLTGGEFFTHPHAYDLLDYILSDEKSHATCVTNSILIDITKISKYTPKQIDFMISIDGDEEKHDLRRGVGTYKKVMSTVNHLKKLGFSIGANMTLIEDNVSCIPDVLAQKAFDSVTFMPVANTGEALHHFSNGRDSEEYENIITYIYKNCREYKSGDERCPIFPRGFSINYDGGIYPCSLARDYGLLKIGDLQHGDIWSEINHFLESELSDQLFEYEKNDQITSCNHCPSNDTCPRGCRIRALKWHDNLLMPDPFACKIFNGKYPDVCYGDIYWGVK